MTLPDRINAEWIRTLSNEQLAHAESQLHVHYSAEETAERRLRGDAYDLMRGPETLMAAWMRWSLVCNALRDRGVRFRYRR